MSSITHVLQALAEGQPQAAEKLLAIVYEELRRLAAVQMVRERPGHTLQATALVHEAYLRLVGKGDGPSWQGRGHFFAAAAQVMRRILVENARRKHRLKRGGNQKRVKLSDHPEPRSDEDLLALDEALKKLADEDPLAAKIVTMRHFAGLGHEDVAAALDITVYAARQKWSYAKAWLRDALA